MKKKLLSQAITLGLLVAAPYSVWASDFTDGFHKDVQLNVDSSKLDCGAVAPGADTVIDKDVEYHFVLNQGKFTSNSGVSAVHMDQAGKTVTYNKNANFYVSTDLTGTGNNASHTLSVYAGRMNFNGDTSFTNITKGENGKSAYGVSALGDPKQTENPVLNFAGNSLKIDVVTDTARQEKGTYCEAAGLSVYNADVVTSDKTKTEINVTGTSTSSKAAPVYGILNEGGNVDLKGDTVINVVTNGYGTNVTEGKDKAGLAVGVKVIDGFYNSTMGNTSGEAQVTMGNAVVNTTNKAKGGAAIGFVSDNFTDNENKKAEIILNGNLDMHVEADIARGVVAKKGKKIILGSENTDHINITTQNISADNSENINMGIWAAAGGVVDVTSKDVVVNTHSTGDAWSYGICAQNATTDAKDNLATVNIKADNIYVNSTADKEGQASGLVTMSQGQMNIHGNLEVHADNVVVTRGDSVLNVNTNKEDANNTTKLYGNINFAYYEGTSGTKVDADVNINLNGKDSVWEGNTIIDWNLKTDGNTSFEDIENKLNVDGCNISLNDGAQWNATKVENTGTDGKKGQAYVGLNNLTLNNGIINLDKMDGQTLEVENLSGNKGTIGVDDLAAGQLHVDKIADNTEIVVQGNGAIADQIFQDKANADKLAGVVVGGADNAVLTDKVTTEEGVIGGVFEGTVDKDGHVVGGIQAQNTFNMGVSDMASVSLMAWRAENDDMNQRLGELRDSKGEHGIWTRMVKGESEYGAITNKYTKYELGYDEKLSTNEHWTVGAAISYTDGDSSFAKGSGENTHKGLSVYGSYLADDGSYVDLIAKYAKLEHEFDVLGGIGKGDYEANGYSVSAEYGKRFTKDNGFWVEPQVQLSYGKVGAVSYATANAIAEQDGMDSLVGRVGFRMGKDFAQGNVYAKASYLYDFDGETSVTMRKGSLADTYGQDLGGGWWEVGVGTNVALSDASYLYLDVERTYGGEVETPWQWNVGLRYSF